MSMSYRPQKQLDAGDVDLLLLVFGVAALVSIWIVGRLVDRYLRAAVLVSLATFAVTALALGFWASWPLVVYTGVAVWGLTFGGAATLLQTALADTAGDGADVALSMNVVAWNSAIAGGGLLGGVLLETRGVASLSWAVLALLLIGFCVAWSAHSQGFSPGRRSSNTVVGGH